MTPRLVAGALALTVVFAACTDEPSATTQAATSTSSTTTSTTLPPTTTTTTEPLGIDLRVDGLDNYTLERISALYLEGVQSWVGESGGQLLGFEDADWQPGTVALSGELHSASIGAGRVGVITIDDDFVLLVDDGLGWQVVGHHLARLGMAPAVGTPIRHVMVIGTDARPGYIQRVFRADSIHLVSSNIEARAGGIVGFPRDSYVEASYGFDKYSSVNVRSARGTDEMVSLAADMSGLPIEGYVITGFAGFTGLVNAFGGFTVDIPLPIANSDAEAYFSKGPHFLNGAKALAFSRVRKGIPGGDLTRTVHQGLVMKAALVALQTRDIGELPSLLAMLLDHTWTDLSLTELVTLGAHAFLLDPLRVGNVGLTGSVERIGYFSAVRLDLEGAELIFRDLDDGYIDG
jgi:LCP family protein required for cell wall assembly